MNHILRSERSNVSQSLALIGWLALCFTAASVGTLVPSGEYYTTLQKPTWSPPGWVFGPIWTTLYTMMAIAAHLVWREGGWARQRIPLTLFLLQLLLNALWTPLFFGWHRPDLAFVDIILLWIALALTIRSFWSVNKATILLLGPYLVWVTIAAALNYSIWQLNK